MKAPRVSVAVEVGSRRAFAFSLDWPGWCRSGRGEEAALEALATSAGRYARVAARAGLAFDGAGRGFAVVERLAGTSTTDFGAPGSVAEADRRPLDAAGAEGLAKLVMAAWAEFDRVAAGARAVLRKGPRGGGRTRDAVVAHVAEVDAAYARRLGIRTAGSDRADPESTALLRLQIADILRDARAGVPVAGAKWLPRYAARRIAWHALDHSWEIEDRSW